MRFAVVLGETVGGEAQRCMQRINGRTAMFTTLIDDQRAEFCGRDTCQPLRSPRGSLFVLQGKIWNHNFLGSRQTPGDGFLDAFERDGNVTIRRVSGNFAMVVCNRGNLFVARDGLGIVPLFAGWKANALYLVQERKAAPPGVHLHAVPPGHFYAGRVENFDAALYTQFFEPSWTASLLANRGYHRLLCKQYLRTALKRRVGVAPYNSAQRAYLLRGDAANFELMRMALQVDTDLVVHTYTAGFADSTDLPRSQRAARQLGTVHHHITLSLDDALAAVPQIVYMLEDARYELVAEAVPLFLLLKICRRDGVGVLLSAHGASTVWGRADATATTMLDLTTHALATVGTTEAWMVNVLGAHTRVDVRMPFLDEDCVHVAMNIAPKQKIPVNGLLCDSGDAAAPPGTVGASWAEALAQAAEARGFASAQAWFSAELRACCK